ncbi:hypothetical protein [Algibacter sp. R77976]|uniref:hypothetical protein n=1 Tax=Algibacter sp. R77976 TaxID=3093873 RepID=UPI0037C95177
MKKTFYLVAFLTLLILSCTKNEITQSKPTTSAFDYNEQDPTQINIETVNYIYQGKSYSLQFDVSDEENLLLLTGKDDEFLSSVYEKNEQLVTVYVNDTTFHLFENMKSYEKSSLYAENELKATTFKRSLNSKKKATLNKSSISISATLPDKGTNFNQEAYLYRRTNFRFNDGGYYVTGTNFTHDLNIPDFRYLNNTSSSFGSNGSSIFPFNSYNTANLSTINHNDAISSIYVNFMVVTIYEHQNYLGQSFVYDGRGLRELHKDLKKLYYRVGSGPFARWKNWNDKISSAKFKF